MPEDGKLEMTTDALERFRKRIRTMGLDKAGLMVSAHITRVEIALEEIAGMIQDKAADDVEAEPAFQVKAEYHTIKTAHARLAIADCRVNGRPMPDVRGR